MVVRAGLKSFRSPQKLKKKESLFISFFISYHSRFGTCFVWVCGMDRQRLSATIKLNFTVFNIWVSCSASRIASALDFVSTGGYDSHSLLVNNTHHNRYHSQSTLITFLLRWIKILFRNSSEQFLQQNGHLYTQQTILGEELLVPPYVPLHRNFSLTVHNIALNVAFSDRTQRFQNTLTKPTFFVVLVLESLTLVVMFTFATVASF